MKKLVSLFCLFFFAIAPACLKANPPTQFPYPANMNDPHIAHLKRHTLIVMDRFDGWCPKTKASAMMDLIIATKPKVCVEIGVFGGSSVYPSLMALRHNQIRGHGGNQNGILFAIDPWKNNEAVKNYDPRDENAIWWSRVDLRQILSKFIANLKQEQLSDLCVILEKTSEDAVHQIPEIDILHIDGNHSEAASVLDVTLYLPKVKEGGYIWFDDISWVSTKKAVSMLLEKCDLIYQHQDDKGSFVLLKKRVNVPKIVEESPAVKKVKEELPAPVTAPANVEVPVVKESVNTVQAEEKTHVANEETTSDVTNPVTTPEINVEKNTTEEKVDETFSTKKDWDDSFDDDESSN